MDGCLLSLRLTCSHRSDGQTSGSVAFCVFVCSIKAYIAATCVKTVLQPVRLDASQPWQQWEGVSQESCDVIVAINLMQYSAFKTAQVRFKRNTTLISQ